MSAWRRAAHRAARITARPGLYVATVILAAAAATAFLVFARPPRWEMLTWIWCMPVWAHLWRAAWRDRDRWRDRAQWLAARRH